VLFVITNKQIILNKNKIYYKYKNEHFQIYR